MQAHIDVLGYLLAAMVFSVGFLAARVHAAYDATEREVHEQSWRMRNALLHGDPIGPAELTDTMVATRNTADSVASLSRLVNYGLFAAMVVVYTAALALLAGGAPGPPEAVLITSMVFLGGASVIVIGELDVRKVDRDRRATIAQSLVGWIGGLSDALAAGRLAEFSARLAALAETYPNWALLTELRAYMDLIEGRPGEGFRRVGELIDAHTYLYLTPVVATACALAEGDSAAGLRLLDQLMARKEAARNLASLRTALALSWARMEIMAHDELPDQPADIASYPYTRTDDAAPWLAHSPEQVEGFTDKSRVLDLTPAQIPQTAALIDLSRAWQRGQDERELRALAEGTPLAAALRLVLPAGTDDAGPDVHDLLQLKDSATLETFGLIFLAQGRTRDALRMIERSIRVMPGNYRTHWAMAVVCHRLGWLTAAEASLQKMNTLLPDTPLLAVSRLAFTRPDRLPSPGDLDEFFPGGCSNFECIQLALLGIAPKTPFGTEMARERFFGLLVESALAATQPKPARAEAPR